MFGNYNPQMNIERIDKQISDLERIKSQLQQPTPTNLTQNFQISPSREFMRYAKLSNISKSRWNEVCREPRTSRKRVSFIRHSILQSRYVCFMGKKGIRRHENIRVK